MRRALLIALLLSSARARGEGPALPAGAAAPGAACTFRTDQTRHYLIPLRLEAGALPFAWLLPHAALYATVPVTRSPSELPLASKSDGVRIEGVAKLSDVELHPATPTLVDGFLVWLSLARLELKSADVDRLEVSIRCRTRKERPSYTRGEDRVRSSRAEGSISPSAATASVE